MLAYMALGESPRRLKFIASSVANVASRSDKPCFRNELYMETRVAASPIMANSSSFAIAISQPGLPAVSCRRILSASSEAPTITCPPTTPRPRNSPKTPLRFMVAMSFSVWTTGVKSAPVVSTAAIESRNT